MRKLFIDMDGVFCDFLGGFHRKFGVSFFDIEEEEAWKLVKAQPNLWLELDPFPGAIDFIDDVIDLYQDCYGFYSKACILTAVPKSSFIASAQNKRAWIHEHIGKNCLHFIPCQGGHNKAGYINNPGDILIDDAYEKNLVPWIKHGGIAIHHPEGCSYDKTFKKLKDTLNGS